MSEVIKIVTFFVELEQYLNSSVDLCALLVPFALESKLSTSVRWILVRHISC